MALRKGLPENENPQRYRVFFSPEEDALFAKSYPKRWLDGFCVFFFFPTLRGKKNISPPIFVGTGSSNFVKNLYTFREIF